MLHDSLLNGEGYREATETHRMSSPARAREYSSLSNDLRKWKYSLIDTPLLDTVPLPGCSFPKGSVAASKENSLVGL